MNESRVWSKSFELNVGCTPEKIWQALIDTANWKQWNPGVNQHPGTRCSGIWRRHQFGLSGSDSGIGKVSC